MTATKVKLSVSIDLSLLLAIESSARQQRRPRSAVINDVLLAGAPVNDPPISVPGGVRVESFRAHVAVPQHT